MARVEDLRNLKLDYWQKRVLNHKGNISLRCGRQTGKSTVVALKAYYMAMQNANTVTLVVAAVQRQSSLLFEKIRAMFDIDNQAKIKKIRESWRYKTAMKTEQRKMEKEVSIFKEEPTLTRIKLKNNSEIICQPTGRTGAGIRGYTVDFLIVDEAARMPEEVWVALTPMLATSRKERGTGWIILLSTPWGKVGYFYESFSDKSFLHIHTTSEQCKRIPKTFLRKEKRKLTKISYSQEYLAEFVEAVRQFFPSVLIKKASTIKHAEKPQPGKKYYLGVDFARYGGDENAFVISEVIGKKVRVIWADTSQRVSTIDPINFIIKLNKEWNFKKIYVDSGGLGQAILDMLLLKLGKKVEGLNNASRPVDYDETHRKKIFKEDLYSNSLLLFENFDIEMLYHPRLISSLKSITFEYTDNERVKIKGKGSHLCEAFVRANWGVKDQPKELFLY